MRPFAYVRPGAFAEALDALRGEKCRALAGGTDLLTLMKADIEQPRLLVDIKRLPELGRRVAKGADALEIGALVTLAEIERHPAILSAHTALAEAAAQAATPQLRNAATLGGNLLQQPRCWYFRNPHLRCWRRGGDACPAWHGENRLHAVFGGGPCHAAHPSDPAVALLALDARVVLHGLHGAREAPLEDLYMLPSTEHRSDVRLGDDELIAAVRLPSSPGQSLYLKAMDRKSWAFALAGVAASVVRPNGGAIESARIVLSGVAPIPWRVPAAEQALVAGAKAEEIARVALEGAEPLRHNAYKVPLARALVRRAVARLLEG
jgi:xanthine dehydrogenase YagS FAD-binding subunit